MPFPWSYFVPPSFPVSLAAVTKTRWRFPHLNHVMLNTWYRLPLALSLVLLPSVLLLSCSFLDDASLCSQQCTLPISHHLKRPLSLFSLVFYSSFLTYLPTQTKLSSNAHHLLHLSMFIQSFCHSGLSITIIIIIKLLHLSSEFQPTGQLQCLHHRLLSRSARITVTLNASNAAESSPINFFMTASKPSLLNSFLKF